LGMVLLKRHIPHHTSHTLKGQHNSRLPQSQVQQSQMATPRLCVTTTLSSMGQSPSRPVCHTDQCQMHAILLLGRSRIPVPRRRLLDTMASNITLCLSSTPSSSMDYCKSLASFSASNPDCTLVAKTTMVCNAPIHGS
ncbi:hypothetical protein JRQ81_016342, partial [Phrynocephalus forsythii]